MQAKNNSSNKAISVEDKNSHPLYYCCQRYTHTITTTYGKVRHTHTHTHNGISETENHQNIILYY